MMRKQKSSKYLTAPTRPIQIDRDRSVAGILQKMEGAGFQARTLADAHNLWLEMLEDNSTVLMGLSGALVAAGMRRLISYLIKNHFVDVVVSTGANLFHDLHETLGRYHYQAPPGVTEGSGFLSRRCRLGYRGWNRDLPCESQEPVSV